MGIAMEQLAAAQATRRAKERDDLLDLTGALARSRADQYENCFALDWIARDKHATADQLRSAARRWADAGFRALQRKVAS
jgi:hypothetical protein